MRAALLCLSTALLLLAPLALADTSFSAGPATASTQNDAYGDGCDGTNGGEARTARVHVADPRGDGYQEAGAVSSCNHYDDGTNTFDGGGLYVYYTNVQFNGQGPSPYAGWYGGASNGVRYCGSYAGVSGVALPLGCPSPDGSAPPMLPALP